MSIGQRVKEIRKALKLTQTAFGKRIDVAQGYLTNIENGQREATDKIIRLICHEFNVDEKWLRTGNGQMFVITDSLDKLLRTKRLTELEEQIIRRFISMDDEARHIMVDNLVQIFTQTKEERLTEDELSAGIEITKGYLTAAAKESV